MQVKRYEVSSMNEAMTKIKSDLGQDAVILSTKKIRVGKQEVFEVMAARDTPNNNSRTPIFNQKSTISNSQEDIFAFFKSEMQQIKASVEAMQRQNSLQAELAEMKETMNSFFDVLGMRNGRMPLDLNRKIYLRLTGGGFSRAAACRIVEAVNQSAAGQAGLSEEDALRLAEKHIQNALAIPGEASRKKRVKMFIGPTGVGKTTTLAKLAARYAIMKKKSVGLISADNFRIAAAEQLETYARIMGLRMERASSREGFAKALQSFADKDIILVDTPGRARPDDGYLHQLEQTLPGRAIETSLLINATGSEDYLEQIISGYMRFRVDNMIVTKIDESRRFGMLYEVLSRTRKPVTYWTCGQNVPQDIEEVTPASLTGLMLAGWK